MLRLLIEEHLFTLHDELCAVMPERREGYAKLKVAGLSLQKERLSHRVEESFEELAVAFEARVAPFGRRRPGMGRILRLLSRTRPGLDRAVPSLEAWAADPSRFPAAW